MDFNAALLYDKPKVTSGAAIQALETWNPDDQKIEWVWYDIEINDTLERICL